MITTSGEYEFFSRSRSPDRIGLERNEKWMEITKFNTFLLKIYPTKKWKNGTAPVVSNLRSVEIFWGTRHRHQ